MRQAQREITINTRGQGLTDVTRDVADFVSSTEMGSGLLTVFVRHTSAPVIIQENADPDVQRDLLAFFRRLVPDGDPLFVHTAEGPDDMPAHVKSALTATSVSIPIAEGQLTLGTWQGIYLFEHRSAPHRRRIVLQAFGI